ncbi:MAG: putative metalloprotease CJM1_0395 family protein [Sedimenticola sp.]|nr:putative metalloprotease CJM1_0395 family protein [Sedimenticola sp.]
MEISFSTTTYSPLPQSTGSSTQEDPQSERERPAITATEKKEALKESNSKESRELRSLQARDREVRAHEQAHLSVAGRYATSGVNLEYQRGPDGQLYAVGGDVKIDTSTIPGDPKATEQKAETIRRAALAPANPSSQDRKVASQASSMALEARAEILEQQITEKKDQMAETIQANGKEAQDSSQLNDRLARSGALSDTTPQEQIDTYI